MRKTIAVLALIIGVFAASGQKTDCIQKIEAAVAESQHVLPLDIAGVATMKSMQWDDVSSTLTLDMRFALSFEEQEAEERMRMVRPALLSIFMNTQPLADMLQCLAAEGGRFVLSLYGSEGISCPGYTLVYGNDELTEALDEKSVSKEDYELEFMQGVVESASVGLPRRVDGCTVLHRVYLEGKTIVYDFMLDDTETGIDVMYLMTTFPKESQAVIAEDIANTGYKASLIPIADKGFGMRYRYRIEGRVDYVDMDFTPEQLVDIIMAGS